MTNDQIRAILERRTSLEDEIKALGGTIPNPWPWDFDGLMRNMQLINFRDELIAKKLSAR